MPATLIVNCPLHLAEVRNFADATGQRTQFEEKLNNLTAYLPDD